MAKYLAAVEVDQRQRVIAASDKLKEMLGSSWTIEDTVEVVQKAVNSKQVQVVMPVSGAVWLNAEDKDRLLEALWAIRVKLVEEMDLPCTFAYVDYPGNDQFDDATSRLRMEVRKRKDNKTGRTGEPAFPHFARCLIQPHTTANIWRPEWENHPQQRRRALVSSASDLRLKRGLSPLTRYQSRPDLRAPVDFEDLLPEGSANQYIALVKADGDGMGRLIGNLSWQGLGRELGISPQSAMLHFSEALQACLRKSLDRAVLEALKDIRSGTRPVAPIVAAGEDIAVLCRRDLAFPLAVVLSETFVEQVRSNRTLQAACEAAAEKTGEKQQLTLSCGVLYARQGFPFEILWDLAGELESLAKEHRKELKEPAGCIDYYWLESTGRPDIERERKAAAYISDGDAEFLLYSRPWTIAEARQVIAVLPELRKISRRKWPQLQTALQLGDSLSDLAYRRWLTSLEGGEQDIFLNAIDKLPERMRPSKRSPWVTGSKGIRRTCLLELYELMEAHFERRP